jgi:hypothetical protein
VGFDAGPVKRDLMLSFLIIAVFLKIGDYRFRPSGNGVAGTPGRGRKMGFPLSAATVAL